MIAGNRLPLVFTALLANFFAPQLHAATFDEAFVVVEFDDASEAKLGGFPSRAVQAQLIERIAQGKPKSIIHKFFLDGPGKEPDNTALVDALGKARVILQATLNRDPPTSKMLDERFFFKGDIRPHKPAVAGDEGWLPLKRFADRAPKVCFPDVLAPERVPMIELFNQRPVESLYACAVAEAFGEGKTVIQSHRARFGDKMLLLDDAAEIRLVLADLNMPATVAAHRVLDPKFDTGVFARKVAIIVYTGARSPTLAVGGAPVKVHQMFLAQLREVTGRLQEAK